MKGTMIFIKFILLLVIVYLAVYHLDEVLYQAKIIVKSLADWLMSLVKQIRF